MAKTLDFLVSLNSLDKKNLAKWILTKVVGQLLPSREGEQLLTEQASKTNQALAHCPAVFLCHLGCEI